MRRVSLRDAPREAVPRELTAAFYFDLDAADSRGVEQARHLRDAHSIGAALDGLHEYISSTLASHAVRVQGLAAGHSRDGASVVSDAGTGACIGSVRVISEAATIVCERLIGAGETSARPSLIMLGKDVVIQGGTLDASAGDIWIGAGTRVEPGVLIRGPAVIGERSEIRRGAYLRGDVSLGAGAVVGCEMKMVLALDGVELPHHGYVGDSLLGHRAHFGCGSVTANFPLFPGSPPSLDLDGVRYELGLRKFGAVVGDGSQLGCGSVTQPGCLLARDVHAYPLSRLPKGVYGPSVLLKHGPGLSAVELRQC